MAVYNPIEVDGRVKRTAASLADHYDLTLVCPRGEGEYRPASYRICRVPLRWSGRTARLLSFWWSIIVMSCRIRPAAVYAHDFFLPLPGWIAARVTGAKFVYDAHELIVPAPGERLTARSWLFYRLERLVVRYADLLIAANPERAEVMRKHYGLAGAPVSIGNVPPLPDVLMSDTDVLELYPGVRKAQADDVHVVYMGDINLRRGLGVLVESCAFLPERFKLVFVGTGPHLHQLRAMASSGELAGRMNIIGPVPHAHVHDVIRMADVGYVSYSMVGLNNILCAPNKVFEYAHAGLPVIATCQPTIRRLFNEHRIGRLVGCDSEVSAQELASAIRELSDDLAHYKAALSAFLSCNTWQRESCRLINSMQAVFQKGGPQPVSQ